MFDRFNISHHSHSGLVRPHEFTSYAPLFLLLVIVGTLLTVSTIYAGPTTGVPESGSIGLEGAMPAKPPKEAAVITSPTNGQRFSAVPITVSGTCPINTLIEIFKNDIFAGSVACTDKGTFSIEIDLLYGSNRLIARVYDALNQAGPDSNEVNITYDGLPPQTAGLASLDFGGDQMLLNTDAVYRGSFPGENMTMPVSIIGGTPPYAINFEWGDSSNNLVPRNDNITFNTTHAYKKAGTYQISLKGTDSQGRIAFMTVAAIINGQPDAETAASQKNEKMNKLLVLWPLYTSAAGIVISFWLGERREKHVLSPIISQSQQ